ncbi:uncharacterized protein METZ01_LOCUS496167 [marine metagenome]|jgi:hypothetical protein|uniref:DUF2203 domain-containing protein n=1 Tax=marine metagenome TaxID=408172 RepID=A0A383DG65_9ZZZZ|tara:strand:- start:52 stop:453 length:402 start_codon:yes stop_codon:yes gene_type:complete
MGSYFTVKSANEILPIVIKKYEHAKKQKDLIIKTEQELTHRMSTEDSLIDYATLKQKLNSVVTKFYQSLEDLESTGVVVKQLDQGLLDFPAKRFEQEIWLCWKEGETEVKFWHEKDSGFMGRKPISVSNESLV